MKQVEMNPRARLKKGLDAVADAVKITIGPKGRNVAIDRGHEPLITNDGGTIAQEITLKDKVENMGAQIIRGVVRKTSEKVGGGRTASAILTQAIVHEGLKHLENGMNLQELKRGMQDAVKDITTNLKKNAKKVKGKEEVRQVASISTESEELGSVIADVVDEVGKDCVVTVEESQSFGISTEIAEGLKFDKGYVSPYMVTNPERMEAELKNVDVLVSDKKISIFKELLPIVQKLMAEGKNSLAVICEDLDGDALNQAVMAKLSGKFNILAIKAPGYQDKSDWIEDIALTVDSEIVSDRFGTKYDTVKLGKAKKIISTKDSTIIMGTGKVKNKLDDLKAQLELADKPWDKSRLEQRIATLGGHVAVIKVGAATESELKYLKQKIEDGVNESKRALEEGIIIGGNNAFIHAAKGLAGGGQTDHSKGYNTVIRAIEAPLRQIVLNVGGKPDVVVNQIVNVYADGEQKQQAVIGYDANSGNMVNMFDSGIIDALKVARTALENAVSGAIMFLTIEASVSDLPAEDSKQRLEY